MILFGVHLSKTVLILMLVLSQGEGVEATWHPEWEVSIGSLSVSMEPLNTPSSKKWLAMAPGILWSHSILRVEWIGSDQVGLHISVTTMPSDFTVWKDFSIIYQRESPHHGTQVTVVCAERQEHFGLWLQQCWDLFTSRIWQADVPAHSSSLCNTHNTTNYFHHSYHTNTRHLPTLLCRFGLTHIYLWHSGWLFHLGQCLHGVCRFSLC